MQKISTAFVTGQVGARGESTIGVCFKEVTLTPAQSTYLEQKLRQSFGGLTDNIKVEYCNNSTIAMVRVEFQLCRRSLSREIRRFGKVLEVSGIVEKVENCSPLPRLNLIH